MSDDLLQKLKDWRNDTAQKEGVELFRVLSNSAIEAIATLKPSTKEELLSIKGIKEKKFAKYGVEVLAIINGEEPAESVIDSLNTETVKALSVSTYLDFLNLELRKCRARIQGEISSVDVREKVIYFSIKDSEDESVLNCLIWKRDYELSGIDFEVGMEVILEGVPDIYKPSGRLAFKALSAELVGEGVLKKAYDQLKKKLEAEGLFLDERKKVIPEFPQKIGLITSEAGAVINDFLTNLGRYGFHIKFMNSRVEGQLAVRELVSAIDYFSDKDIDVLVIIRGGGSLESLQAFNNEALVRKIADFKVPVICGIGHDKDVPLASLAADKAVSTPSLVPAVLNKSWEKVINDIAVIGKDIVYKYQGALDAAMRRVETATEFLLSSLKRGIENKSKMLGSAEKQLQIFDPSRQLRLGYSIVSVSGRVVKNVTQVNVGEELDIKVSDGNIKSVVNNINQQ